jgi:hypothetical protein
MGRALVSVLLLLLKSGSVTSGGSVIEAVLTSVPGFGAEGLTVPLTV